MRRGSPWTSVAGSFSCGTSATRRTSGLKDSLHQDVFQTSSPVEHRVNLHGLISGDSIDDSPRRFVHFAPCSITDGAQFWRCAAALWQNLEGLAAGNDTVKYLRSTSRSLIEEVGTQ